jgi:hypothetical protein
MLVFSSMLIGAFLFFPTLQATPSPAGAVETESRPVDVQMDTPHSPMKLQKDLEQLKRENQRLKDMLAQKKRAIIKQRKEDPPHPPRDAQEEHARVEKVAVPGVVASDRAPAAAPAQVPVPANVSRFPHEGGQFGPRNERQEAVVRTMKWAWQGYKDFAWGHDELLPVTKSHSEWFHLGLTIVDALDTLIIMGMETEFLEAKNWVEHDLKLDQDVNVNLFETTIRVLGGLLSAYHLSNEQVFLDRAVCKIVIIMIIMDYDAGK